MAAGHDLPWLSRAVLGGSASDAPIRVLQLGEGRFVRTFVDAIIQTLNDTGRWRGRVLMTNLRPTGADHIAQFQAQDGLFTAWLRDDRGETIVPVTVVSPADRDREWATIRATAEAAELQAVVTNATESGYVLPPETTMPDGPSATMPGQLTALLWARYRANPETSLLLLPTELLDRNGDRLMALVQETAARWALDPRFAEWLGAHVRPFNTLVDRIVTGLPADPASYWNRLGYRDAGLSLGERYGKWWIEGDEQAFEAFPLQAAPEVELVPDLAPYHALKIFGLNGTHLLIAGLGLLRGHQTVADAMSEPWLKDQVERYWDAVRPTIPLPVAIRERFFADLATRFGQRWIGHRLEDIQVRMADKWWVRIAPVVEQYFTRGESPPAPVILATAAVAVWWGRETPAPSGDAARWLAEVLRVPDPPPGWWSRLVDAIRPRLASGGRWPSGFDLRDLR